MARAGYTPTSFIQDTIQAITFCRGSSVRHTGIRSNSCQTGIICFAGASTLRRERGRHQIEEDDVMTEKTPGQVLFEAFWLSTSFPNLYVWNNQIQSSRERWERIARSVVEPLEKRIAELEIQIKEHENIACTCTNDVNPFCAIHGIA